MRKLGDIIEDLTKIENEHRNMNVLFLSVISDGYNNLGPIYCHIITNDPDDMIDDCERKFYGGVGSWRGDYAYPSIRVEPNVSKNVEFFIKEKNQLTVKELRDDLQALVDSKIMYGYKGGEFEVDVDDMVYLDSYGRSSSLTRVVVDVIVADVYGKKQCIVVAASEPLSYYSRENKLFIQMQEGVSKFLNETNK